MEAGKLNRRVVIQRKASVRDGIGGVKDSWEEVAKVWARIINVSGMHAVKADAAAATLKTSIRIRYRNDICAGMRVIAGTVQYSVVAVLPDEEHRKNCDLVCEVHQ